MKVNVYNEKGESVSAVGLKSEPKSLVSQEALLQVVSVLRDRLRKHNANTKTRGDISGGGKKPWRQKGTGRARQGSTRAPHWRGGGASHGPNSLRRERKLNEKVVKGAFRSVLLSKISEGNLILIEDMGVLFGKTKDFSKLLSSLKISGTKILFLTTNLKVARSARNIDNVYINSVNSVSVLDLLTYGKVILDEKDFEELEKRANL